MQHPQPWQNGRYASRKPIQGVEIVEQVWRWKGKGNRRNDTPSDWKHYIRYTWYEWKGGRFSEIIVRERSAASNTVQDVVYYRLYCKGSNSNSTKTSVNSNNVSALKATKYEGSYSNQQAVAAAAAAVATTKTTMIFREDYPPSHVSACYFVDSRPGGSLHRPQG